VSARLGSRTLDLTVRGGGRPARWSPPPPSASEALSAAIRRSPGRSAFACRRPRWRPRSSVCCGRSRPTAGRTRTSASSPPVTRTRSCAACSRASSSRPSRGTSPPSGRRTASMAEMSYYPVLLDLAARPGARGGRGPVAERRVDGLLAAGAHVIVIAPRLTPALAAMSAEGRIEHEPRGYRDGDLAGADLAFVATDAGEVNTAVA